MELSTAEKSQMRISLMLGPLGLRLCLRINLSEAIRTCVCLSYLHAVFRLAM